MSDLILDIDIAIQVCSGHIPDVDKYLDRRRDAGLRNWLYIGQQSLLFNKLCDLAIEKGSQQSEELVREWIDILLEKCMWLSALSEDGSVFHDSDPMALALAQAADRLGQDVTVLTSSPARLQRGQPFINVTSLLQQGIQESTRFVDLLAQQDFIRTRLERNVHRVLHHGSYIMGPEIAELEERLAAYVGVDYCICVSSGTDALQVSMMALGIGVGDEVITTPFSFFASIEVILLLGAVPVYVDIDPDTYNMDVSKLEKAVTTRTKAILPVSLYGQCSDMDVINEIAGRFNLAVIEDAAQSFGATYKQRRSCSLSSIGCTSFFPSKPLGAYGDSGACLTQDRDLAQSIRELSNHGQSRHYEHNKIGINGRMDTLQAAILLAKFEIFEDELIKRNLVAERYNHLFEEAVEQKKLRIPMVEAHNESAWSQYTVEVDQREEVRRQMLSAGIPISVHYPVPLYLQSASLQEETKCPRTEFASQQVMSLPMHPYLTSVSQERIARTLLEAVDF